MLPEIAPSLFGPIGTSAGLSTGFVAGFAGGFIGTYISTGNLAAALTGGLISGITGLITAGVSYDVLSNAWTPAEGVIARVATGCLSSVASSGNCGKGALSAGFAIAAQPFIIKVPDFGEWSAIPEAVEAGLIGGEATKLEGGKFIDGFSTSAVQYLAAPPPHSSSGDMGVLAQVVRDVNAIAVDIYAVVAGQLGALYVFVRYDLWTVAADAANGDFLKAFGAFGTTIYDLLVPHYGYYGGSRWGTLQFPAKANGDPSLNPLNALDYNNFQHDLSCPPCASGTWASNNFTSNQGYLPAGPFGMAYELFGLVPFTIAGAAGH